MKDERQSGWIGFGTKLQGFLSQLPTLDLCLYTSLVLQERLQKGHLSNSHVGDTKEAEGRGSEASLSPMPLATDRLPWHFCWPRSPAGWRLLEEANPMGRSTVLEEIQLIQT